MMQWPFNTLRVQLVLLVVAALTAAQIVSLWLFVDERSLAIRAAFGFEAAGRAANVARLIDEAPPDLHASILRAANSPLVRFDMSDEPIVTHTGHSDGGLVEARVRALLGDTYSRDIRVELHQIEGHFPNRESCGIVYSRVNALACRKALISRLQSISRV